MAPSQLSSSFTRHSWSAPILSKPAEANYRDHLFIGLVAAKLLAEKLLSVPWLVHLDVYRTRLRPYRLSGGHRPDLVGALPNRSWLVMEAKGRTNGFTQPLLGGAKRQALGLSRIGGTRPALNIASISHFGDGHLSVHWQDPTPEVHDGFLDIDRSEFLVDYYKSTKSLLSSRINETQKRRVAGREILALKVPAADLELGIVDVLLTDPDIEKASESVSKGRESVVKDDEKLGIDGIYVALGPSWHEQSMARQPEERGNLGSA